jgi:AcrR family transcriptional regulator
VSSTKSQKRQTSAASTGDTVYAVAVDLMFERGYHGTSLRDVAKAVGVQMSSLYHYYPSKQALLVAIMDGTMLDFVSGATAAMDAVDGPRAKLIAGIRYHVGFQTGRYKESFIADSEVRALEGENRVRNVKMRDQYEQLFVDVLRDGCDSRVFNWTGDLDVTVAGLFAMLNGVAAWYRPGGRLTLDEIGDQYCELFLNGVAARRLAIPRAKRAKA